LDPNTAWAEVIDWVPHVWQGRFAPALSPAGIALPFANWAGHSANTSAKQAALVEKAVQAWMRLGVYLSNLATKHVLTIDDLGGIPFAIQYGQIEPDRWTGHRTRWLT